MSGISAGFWGPSRSMASFPNQPRGFLETRQLFCLGEGARVHRHRPFSTPPQNPEPSRQPLPAVKATSQKVAPEASGETT